MQNTLKPESAPVIQDLYEANIRTIMITGKNYLNLNLIKINFIKFLV